jgi:APA family basic amino acid/polyamine antiporter
MKLKRSIGLLEVIFYGVGIIVGAGIYSLVGPAAGMTGNSLWISFLIAAVIASFTGLSYCELSAMFPKAAAEYVYIRRSFGSRFLAFLVGWLIVITAAISIAAVSLAFSNYLIHFINISTAFIIPITLLLIVILSYINFRGIKESAWFNIIFVCIEILGLILIIFIGLPSFGKVNYLEAPFGIAGIVSAAALIFFAYIGFEDIANVAEETRKPRKVIPKALIISIIISTVLYALTAISAVSVVNWKELSQSNAPLSLVASQAIGNNASSIISLIALFATSSTVLTIMIASTRMLYGMGREKSLPEFISLVHEKNKTPWTAIISMMILSMVFVFLGDIKIVANLTSLAAFCTFAFVNLSLIWMRYTLPKEKRLFKVPLNIGKFPVLAFLGFVSSLVMIMQFKLTLMLFGFGIIALGVLIYLTLIRRINE